MILPGPVWGAGICLACMIATGLQILSAQRERERWRARLGLIAAPLHRAAAPAERTARAAVAPGSPGRRPLPRFLLGWREERRAHYPLHWAPLLALCLAPAAGACWLAARLAGSAAWALLPLAAAGLARAVLAAAAARVSARLLEQFPDALSAIARAVRIGVPLGEAVRLVARDSQSPTREEFARAADQAMIGLPLDAALRDMAERTGVTEYRFFATALTLQSQTGGALTETLDNLGDTIRKRRAAAKRAHALASEARTSTYVLAALPLVVGALLGVLNPGYVGVLFQPGGGQKLLAYACFSLVMGLLAMRWIIARSLG
jgi:tight adherence protein B